MTTSPEPLPSASVLLEAVARWLEFLQQGERLTPDEATELVMLWNTIELLPLQDDADLRRSDRLLSHFTVRFFNDCLPQAARVLDARPARGLGLYSAEHDLSVGGIPPENSYFKVPLGVARVSGGVRDLTFDVTIEVARCLEECSGLQAIQVVWKTAGEGPGAGTVVRRRGRRYDAFVDGGRRSPFLEDNAGQPAHPTRPYYLTAGEVSEYVAGCQIRVIDLPTAVRFVPEAFFETAIICIDHRDSGTDKVVQVFRWGWVDYGGSFQTGPDRPKQPRRWLARRSPEKDVRVSDAFREILAADYPSYTLV
jgi:hypothetical protein